MPALHNVKWEMFCRHLAMGKNLTQAYIAAGYENTTSCGSAASILSKRPEIKARMQELIDERIAGGSGTSPTQVAAFKEVQQRAAIDGVIDPLWVVEQLIENVKLSREAGQFAASNKALEMLGKEVGLFREENAKNNAKEKDTKDKASSKAKDSISLDKVNQLLEKMGFEGTVDLSTMEVVASPDAVMGLTS